MFMNMFGCTNLQNRSLYFLASNKPLNLERRMLEDQDSILNDNFYRSIGYASIETFLASLVMDDVGLRKFSELGRVITDDFNICLLYTSPSPRDRG